MNGIAPKLRFATWWWCCMKAMINLLWSFKRSGQTRGKEYPWSCFQTQGFPNEPRTHCMPSAKYQSFVPFDEGWNWKFSEHINPLEITSLGRRCFGRRGMVVMIENPSTSTTACHQILTGGHSVELIIANDNDTVFFFSPLLYWASQYRDRE